MKRRKVIKYDLLLGNEPYLKAIEDDANDSLASDEKLRLKHTVVCSQEGIGPSSIEALKLRWRILRRWCEARLKEILCSPDDQQQHVDFNTFLMRQLVGKVGNVMGEGDDDKVAAGVSTKEYCEACKSEILPFRGSEEGNGDPLKAMCPGNHATLRCMRTLRICSDVANVLTCPLCSSICLVTFPTMPCLFCDMTLCK